jgi:hypothetical protein
VKSTKAFKAMKEFAESLSERQAWLLAFLRDAPEAATAVSRMALVAGLTKVSDTVVPEQIRRHVNRELAVIASGFAKVSDASKKVEAVLDEAGISVEFVWPSDVRDDRPREDILYVKFCDHDVENRLVVQFCYGRLEVAYLS